MHHAVGKSMHTSVDCAVDNAVRLATGFSSGLPEALSFGLSADFHLANWLLSAMPRNLLPQVLLVRLSPAVRHRWIDNEQWTTQ